MTQRHYGDIEIRGRVYGNKIIVGKIDSPDRYEFPVSLGNDGDVLTVSNSTSGFTYVNLESFTNAASAHSFLVSQKFTNTVVANTSGNLQTQINNINQESTTITSSGGTIVATQNGSTWNVEVVDYISNTEVTSISGDLQNQINNINQESTTITSSGGTIVATQNGSIWNVDVIDYVSNTEVTNVSGDLQNQIDSINANISAGPLTNYLYVDQNGNDLSGDGSILNPFQTISAALTSIGDASTTVEYETYNQGTYVINVAPGEYTEDITIPRRQVINIKFNGAAKLIGDVTFTADTSLGASSHPPKLTITGDTNRPGWTSNVPIMGIVGDVYFGSDSLTNFVAILDLKDIYIQGEIICGFAGSGSNHLQLYTENVPVENGIRHTASNTQPVYLYLTDTDNRGPFHGIGGIGRFDLSNNFRFRSLKDVYISGPVYGGSSQFSGRMVNVEFGDAIDLNGSSSTINIDAVSYGSLVDNLSGSNTATINFLDRSDSIENTSTVPGATVENALDNLDTILTNVYYVAQNGNDSTGDGSISRPFQTISAVMTDIGDAANTAEYEDYNSSSFLVHVGPGEYTENITIPDRQMMNIHLHGAAKIIGDINYTASTVLGGSSHPPRLTITGDTNRTGFSANVPIVGIIGNINFGNETTTSIVAILDLQNIYVQGDIISAVAVGGGGRHNQLYGTNLAVEGTIRNSTNTTAYLSIYVHNSDWNDEPQSLGQIGASGFTNNMRLKSLHNVHINGKVFAESSVKDWRLTNVIFDEMVSLNGSSSTIQLDSVSYKTLSANLSGANTATIQYLDFDDGIENTSTVPGETVKDALDNLDTRVITLSADKIDGSGTANEIAFFADTKEISGNNTFTFDGNDVIVPDVIVDSLNPSLSGNFLTWDSQKRLIDSGFTGDGRYLATFTNADLSSGVLTVNHNLGEKYTDVVIINELDRIVQSDNVEFITNNQLTVDLSSHTPISSTWRILVLAKGSFSSNNTILRQNMYFSADFDNPNNSDWVVNALAPADADSNNAALLIREFDDTTEEGIGFTEYVPDGATQLTITFTARAETSPGSNSNIRYKSYVRQIDPNSSISAWTAGYAHSSIPIGTNENWQVIEETINLSTVGITGDETQVQFEVTRDNSVSNNLAGDAILYSIKVEWS